jgi:shikimate dehydrogenase
MDGSSCLVSRESIRRDSVVFDLIYKPLETPLLRFARERGAKPLDGLWMLIHQAVEALKIWTGISTDPLELRKILEGVV